MPRATHTQFPCLFAGVINAWARRNGDVTATSFALLLLRLVTGTPFIGHGAQKLLGAFGGRGPEEPRPISRASGSHGARVGEQRRSTETTGGVLIALGLMSPVGPIILVARATGVAVACRTRSAKTARAIHREAAQMAEELPAAR